MLRKTAFTAGALLFSAAACADQGFYAGASAYLLERQESDAPGIAIPRVRPVGAGLTGGYQINRHLAVELRGLTARSKTETLTVNGQGIGFEQKLDYAVSGMLKGILPIGRTDVNAYAVIGATHAREKIAIPELEFSGSSTDTDFSYGVGLEMWATSTWGAQLELSRLYDSSGVSFDALSVGFLFRF